MFGKIWFGVAAALLAAASCAGVPSALAQEDDEPRRDVTIGNPDRMRSGENERGDNEMVIESKPKRKQDVPDIGPIYVIPQVNNQGRGQGQVIPVPVPTPQQGARPAPQAPGHGPARP